MSECIICYEKFKYNDPIIACHCPCLLHRQCYNSWTITRNNQNYTQCVCCQQVGYLYTDKYDLYYYLKKWGIRS
jgi:hypothetical protein